MIKNKKSVKGFTLVELIIAMAISVIAISAIGIAMFDGHRGWQNTYDKVYSDVVTDSFIARIKFDSLIRKASSENVTLGDTGEWIEVDYYNSSASTKVDRYARIYKSGSSVYVEYGSIDDDAVKATTSTEKVCDNVSSCSFTTSGTAAQMVITLDDNSQSNTVVTSAIMHN